MTDQGAGGGLSGPVPEAAVSFQRAKSALQETAFGDSARLNEFPLQHARLVDRYFQDRLEEIRIEKGSSAPLSFAVLAVGGYGRSELCLHSDIDILILYSWRVGKDAEEISRKLFFPLWDMNLDLGHGVRDIGGSLTLAKSDFQVFTSLLSSRFLCGNREIFKRFMGKFAKLSRKKFPGFLDWLEHHNRIRAQEFGEATALLEPELKNGLGGLRDLHQMHWICTLLHPGQPAGRTKLPEPFSPEDEADLKTRAQFLLAVRNCLHFATKRKNDRLYFDLQPRVADLLSFAAPRRGLAVERFLARLHSDMNRIRGMHEVLLQQVRKTPFTSPVPLPPGIRQRPDGLEMEAEHLGELLHALELVGETGIPLSWRTRRMVGAGRGMPLESSRETLLRVVGILCAPHGEKAASFLLESGLLGAWIPPLGEVQDIVQFDAYHLHPVGWHSIKTVSKLIELKQPETVYSETWSRVEDPESLVLAALLHDIGKGAGEHEARGAEKAARFLTGLGFSDEIVRDVEFLICNHLLLFKTATRLDLQDESAVADCAGKVGTSQRLDMLFLLSVSDAMATGPKSWNEWVSSLLNELYFKLAKLLNKGHLSEPDTLRRMVATRDRVRLLAEKIFDRDFVEHSLEHMPSRYVLTLQPEEIVDHLQLIRTFTARMDEEGRRVPGGKGGRGITELTTRTLPQAGCYEVVIVSRDQNRLFAAICGVLALYDLNILSAEIFTWSNGTVVDLFKVQSLKDDLFIEEVWARVSRSIKYAMTGKLSLDYRLDEKRNSPFFTPSKPSGREPVVSIDNETSDFYTIVEVVADDRLGRLYEIAEVFNRMCVEVKLAKIATHGDRIADIFYVRDGLGQKIEAPDTVKEVERAVFHAIFNR
ncbi:MAG: HD domain-containing protein [Desulfovibrionales bacterium]